MQSVLSLRTYQLIFHLLSRNYAAFKSVDMSLKFQKIVGPCIVPCNLFKSVWSMFSYNTIWMFILYFETICYILFQTTSKGKSYFEAHKKYKQWEEMLEGLKKGLPSNSTIQSVFQTSEFWPEVSVKEI